jgi:AraC-like DNA-binding protein
MHMYMCAPRDVPEHACLSFEHCTGWDLCLHDHERILWQYMPPSRFSHQHLPCTLVKRHQQERCAVFDGERAAAAAERVPGGLVKRCHAGLVEVVITVPFGGSRWLTVFAGTRRAGPGVVVEMTAESTLRGDWTRPVAALPATTTAELRDLAELLTQLGARLVQWRTLALPMLAIPDADPSRRERIHAWIKLHHSRRIGLADLAAELGLSMSRVSHVVTACCGSSFASLLLAERMRSATELLRRSDLPMAQIATASGFGDRTRFQKAFASAMGVSPARWRRQLGAAVGRYQ